MAVEKGSSSHLVMLQRWDVAELVVADVALQECRPGREDEYGWKSESLRYAT